MTSERIEQISNYLVQDVEKTKNLLEKEPEEAAALLTSEGFAISAEELAEYGEELKKLGEAKDGELGESDLENVAGGVAAATVILVGMAIGYIIGRGRPW